MGFTLRRSPSEDRRLRANAAAAARSNANGTHRSSRTRHAAAAAVAGLPRDSSKHSLTSSDEDDDNESSSTASSSSSSWSTSSSSFPANVPLRAALQSASALRVPPPLPRSVERTDSDELGAEERAMRRIARRYEAMGALVAADPHPPRSISQESARDLLARTRAAARRLRDTRRRLELASQTARRAQIIAAGTDSASSDSESSSMDMDRVQSPPQYIAAPSASTAPFWSLVVRLDGMLADSVHQTHAASPVTFSRDAYQTVEWQTPRGALIADGIVPVTDRVRMLASPAPTAGPGMEPVPVGEDAATWGVARRVVNATADAVQRHLA
ncbi:hypothetical protein GGF32_002011 [Allomyces javanicus]|nr:hypothetical protein GGF32_002011 [Allomyces javanicus]